MAFETEFGNFITQGNAVAGMMGPAYVAKSFGMNVVRTEQFPDTTNTIKVPISGYLIAETVGESTNYTYSANSELVDSSVTCTAEKSVASARISVEALRFAQPHADMARTADNLAAAHARLFDSKLKALYGSLSQSVTATTILTKDNLLDARYNCTSGTDGNMSGVLVGTFDYKGVNEIRKELTSVTASAFSNKELLSLVNLEVPGAAPVGEFAGIQIYETSGLSTSGGDDIAAVFDPYQTFFAGVDVGNGFAVKVHDPRSDNGLTYEVLTWGFFKVVIWRNTSGCKVLSDT